VRSWLDGFTIDRHTEWCQRRCYDLTTTGSARYQFDAAAEQVIGSSAWLKPSRVERDRHDVFVSWRWPDSKDLRSDMPGPEWTARDEARILHDFLLTDADPERVESFCRTWGVLDLCKHGLPQRHHVRQTRSGVLPCAYTQAPALSSLTRGDPEDIPHDIADTLAPKKLDAVRLDHWQTAVTAMRAISAVGRALRPGNAHPTHREEWNPIADWLGYQPFPLVHGGPKAAVQAQRQALVLAVNRLLQWSSSGPRLTWLPGDGTPRLQTHVDGALGAVILRLALDVAGAPVRPTVTCHYCHTEYTPKKQPKDYPKVTERPCCGSADCRRRQGSQNTKRRRDALRIARQESNPDQPTTGDRNG
jgi:hypothetical protein